MIGLESYYQCVKAQLRRCFETQGSTIARAAEGVARSLQAGGVLYTFGTGHSHLLALEPFYRAGGLAGVIPILDEGLMLHAQASHSTELEREPHLADRILSRYRPSNKDTILILSNSGRNTVVVDMALLAKSKGLTVIALTNLAHANAWPSRHASGRSLHQIADCVLDNGGVQGDACLELPGLNEKLGPTSTITGAFLIHSLLIATTERLLADGTAPEIYISSNADGDRHNAGLIAKFKNSNPHL